jgi:hypothetical protein
MQSILEAMLEDLDSRWGEGSDIRKYSLEILGTNKGSYGNVVSS